MLFGLWAAGLALASPVPFFRNFAPSDYDAMSQNWSVAQDSLGYIYVGNNACLLRFNGKGWEKFFPLGDRKEAVIRSLYADDSRERIYVGSFREFGFLEYDAMGNLAYTSLYEKLEAPPDENEDIWYITRWGKHVFFVYFTSYYIYDTENGQLHREVAPTSYFYSQGDRMVLSSASGAARGYDGRSFSFSPVPLPSSCERIVKMFPGPSEGSRWAVSADKGLFLLEEGKAARRVDKLKNAWDVANRAIQCADGTIVVGFLSGGVSAFGPSGEVLWHFSSENGLQDNTVLSLLEDKEGNIWCALDKGVSVIFKDGDRMLSLDSYNLGKISVSLWDGTHLFVGSNQGLSKFEMDEQSLRTRKVAGYFPNSQLWSLHAEDGNIFVGENGGAYLVDRGRMRWLSSAPGGTAPRILRLRNGAEVLVQGSFTFLYVYERERDTWRLSHQVEGFMRPVRHLEVDYLGNIWLEHMYEGLFKLVLSEDGRRVAEEQYFPLNGAKLCKMGGRVLFHNQEGFWFYDERNAGMAPFEPLRQFRCRRVIPAGKDLYWLVRQSDALLLRFHLDEAAVVDRLDFGSLNVSLTDLFESIIPLSDNRFLFGVENGFLVHALPDSRENAQAKLRFSAVSVLDSGQPGQSPLSGERLSLPNRGSFSLSMAVSGVKYLNPDVRYELVPYDYQPRVLGADMRVSYVHLPAGSYTFRAWLADAPDASRIELPIVVKPSVFASVPAIVLYFLLGIGTVAGIIWLLRRRMDKQLRRMEQEKEKELLSLRNEQLEASILLKSKELATYSLIEARRNQVFDKLKENLSRIRYQKDGVISKTEYEALQTIIREGEFSQSSWEHFYSTFDLIHKSFFRTLQQRHPDLTSGDLRICAYLRLNMSTKELSSVMGVSLKGAEAAKYRLRKKLSLPSDVSLSEYLSSIGGA